MKLKWWVAGVFVALGVYCMIMYSVLFTLLDFFFMIGEWVTKARV